ncbi:MAG TPA: periplasmic heavy metal sensor [bacterium (Candidatus Stahlbacteria)]|nr:periplasmic heavy metal sensor [Candidatus Stahlbacteria bacterium]
MKYLLLIMPMLLIGQPPMEEFEARPPEEIGPMAEAHMTDFDAFEDLDETEKAKIEEIRYKTQVEMIKLRSKIQLKRLDLMKAMKADKPNLSKIKTIVREISDLQAEAKIMGIEQMLKVRDIVGPENWKKMHAHKRKRMRKFIKKFRCGE